MVTLILVVLIIALIGINDINLSIADTGILDDDIASNHAEAENLDPSSATVTITMRTISS